jgi:beta-galactosidase
MFVTKLCLKRSLIELMKVPPISEKVPHMLHGADYNPDQWLAYPDVFKEDIRLMKLAGCNVMSVGIFSWVGIEPEEGVFQFEWLDHVLDTFAKNDIYAFLATPSGSRPAWMSEKYPEVLRVGANRVRNLHGVRHNHCYSSPVYREKVQIMNSKLAERYAFHPAVIGWHISNEYGGDCHCDYCQAAYREWLKEKYGSLDKLNHAWWTTFWSHTYTSWEQIESPAPHGEMQVHGMNLDWNRFVTDRTVDFYKHELAPLKAVNPAMPATANMMYNFKPLNYRKFADVMDFVSWDAYPTWHDSANDSQVAASFAFNHDVFRSLKKRPFFLMESTPSLTNWQPVSKLKRPGMHRLSSLQAVAHGSDSVQYFQWRKSRGSSEKFHGAVVDHVGHEHTRVFKDVADLGATLGKLSDIVGTTIDAKAAILFDWESWWAVDDAQGPRNGGLKFLETVMQHYRAFWELGISVDIIGPEDDFSGYKLITAPMLYLVSDETGAKVEQYVEAGGTFTATYWSGIVNETDLTHLGGFPGPLRKTLGIWSEETEGLYDHDRNGLRFEGGNSLGLEGQYEIHEICELTHLEGATALAVYTDDFYAGRPVLTVNALGSGKAYHLAARVMDDAFYQAFYKKLAEDSGVVSVLATQLPQGVTASARTDGEHEFVFIMNFSGNPQTVELDKRAYTDEESGAVVTGAVELPVNGVRVLKR